MRFTALDAFREVPVELTQGNAGGGFVTVVAAVVCAVLFYFEAGEFVNEKTGSRVVMDTTQNELLMIMFDMIFYDLECQYLNVGVRDRFGTERFNIQQNIQKRSIEHDGVQGAPYTAEELLYLDHEDISADERAELDSDWTSTPMHHDFPRVIDSNDFTMVLFYARATKAFPNMKCTPCTRLRPIWDEFEAAINGRDTRSNVRTHVIKINCAEYNLECVEQKVSNLPTIRLYRRGLDALRSYAVFKPEEATVPALTSFLDKKIAEMHKTQYAGYKIHNYFPSGCRVDGYVEVSRVPGSLHFEAVNGPMDNLNFAATNVSHKVMHLSFRQPGDHGRPVGVEGTAPIDGREFTVDGFHQAPHHYLTIVATNYAKRNKGMYSYLYPREDPPKKVYQLTHQSRTATVARTEAPSARFYYDLSPVEVQLTTTRGKEWYDFITTLFAVIGGTYSVAAMLSGFLQTLRSTLLSI
eukprot:TRINITY_DN16426_c0_g1_i1.p1 TRINITY_DN16426_c0_g1~~TRINITY_DN16426_c0_g1_i1.p1  ORF type:complete len:476 (+),score=165.27 TRINITY_DN16426_c0_g1_i1:28-1428(+)